MKKHLILLSLMTLSSLQASGLANKLQENSLVVYNQNMGLVHEKRSLFLDKGRQELIYPEVASTVVTDSVKVSLPKGIELFSQKYRYDKINLTKLLKAHIDKEVEVKIWNSKENFSYHKATLLSAESRVLLRLKEGGIVQAAASDIRFKTIPKTLITKPSLLWDVRAHKKLTGALSVDYIINNISWRSDYILNVHQHKADLSGWVTLANNSGKAFHEVDLKVLAGDVAREQKKVYPRRNQPYASMVMKEAGDAVREVSHEGYHIYSIPFKVNLANNEKTQIEFINEKGIKIERRYDVMLNSPRYFRAEQKHKVNQYIEFKDLPKPLPMGTVRTYSTLDKATVLLGVNQIEHRAKKQKVSLKVGKNFDLEVKEKNLYLNEDEKYFESQMEYTITNRSNESKKVELHIPFAKRSNLASQVQSKIQYRYKDGNTLAFSVYVKADGVETFTVKYRNKR